MVVLGLLDDDLVVLGLSGDNVVLGLSGDNVVVLGLSGVMWLYWDC